MERRWLLLENKVKGEVWSECCKAFELLPSGLYCHSDRGSRQYLFLLTGIFSATCLRKPALMKPEPTSPAALLPVLSFLCPSSTRRTPLHEDFTMLSSNRDCASGSFESKFYPFCPSVTTELQTPEYLSQWWWRSSCCQTARAR